jgi:hypothetical protein
MRLTLAIADWVTLCGRDVIVIEKNNITVNFNLILKKYA